MECKADLGKKTSPQIGHYVCVHFWILESTTEHYMHLKIKLNFDLTQLLHPKNNYLELFTAAEK